MRDLLITTGFPRSGNTYLNYSFKSLYYPEENPRLNFHSVSSMGKHDHLFVPFRNPQDCIASWHNYPSNGQLEEDIKYYLRFYTAALENLNKLTLMDFNKFTKDLEYIKDKVKSSIDIEGIYDVSDEEIKGYMLNDKKNKNLPLPVINDVSLTKEALLNTESFKECLVIYNNLLKASS